MDPLILLDQAVAQEKVPRAMAKKVRLRMKYVLGAVHRVEKASGLRYPPYYIEPTLPLSRDSVDYGQTGVLFARVIPTTATGSLTILIQFTATLVAFGTKGTIEAVAAHEFTHYVDLVRRMSKMNASSEERTSSLFEADFADSERTVPPRLLYSEKSLVGLMTKKFKPGLNDPGLSKKAADAWIAKNLPVRWIDMGANVVRLDSRAVAGTRFDPAVVARAAQIEEKMNA